MSDGHDNQPAKAEISDSDIEHTVATPFSCPEITGLEIHTIIGKGGSGTVYKGCQPFLKRDIAVKLLNITQADDEFTQRFHREAQILARLTHTNIVTCYQAGMTDELPECHSAPFIAMEFINGPSLHNFIKNEGKLAESLALDITISIADALNYALKQDIIHRDIKAENILLNSLADNQELSDSPDAFNFTPKLADLGIARTSLSDDSENLTVAGYMMGTPSSMAPEQFNDPDHVDFKADIYGLGCVLFHMLTGQKPYHGKNLTELVISKNSGEEMNPRSLEPSLNKELSTLVCSMLARDKNDRPESYEDLINQCQILADKLKHNKSPRLPQKSRSKMVLLLAIVVAIGLGAGTLLWQDNTSQIKTPDTPEIAPSETSVLVTQTIEPTPVSNSAAATKPEPEPEPEPEPSIIKKTLEIPVSEKKNRLEILYVDKKDPVLSPGEAFHIIIRPEMDAYIYCFFENQNSEVIRFFPNRFKNNALVTTSSPLVLPGEMPFDMNASQDGIHEQIACFASDSDITADIEALQPGTDFETLSFSSLTEVNNLFNSIKNGTIAEQFFNIIVH